MGFSLPTYDKEGHQTLRYCSLSASVTLSPNQTSRFVVGCWIKTCPQQLNSSDGSNNRSSYCLSNHCIDRICPSCHIRRHHHRSSSRSHLWINLHNRLRCTQAVPHDHRHGHQSCRHTANLERAILLSTLTVCRSILIESVPFPSTISILELTQTISQKAIASSATPALVFESVSTSTARRPAAA